MQAGNSTSPLAAAALDHLCRMYWYPLYAFCRRQGNSPEDAQDLTQSFFARLLEKDALKLADRSRGRFRTFLLTSFRNFLVNEWTKSRAERRGAGAKFVPWDAESSEHLYAWEAVGTDPETLFDKRWATTVLERALQQLREESQAAGKAQHHDLLKSFIWGEPSSKSHADLGRELNMSEGAVAVMVHRMRTRFREILREEIPRTVAEPADIDDELRYLVRVMGQ